MKGHTGDVIVLRSVTKLLHGQPALRGVSLRITPGEFVCVTGKSGSGKSLLLSLFTGGTSYEEGTIQVDGVDLRRIPAPILQIYRKHLGIVFQDRRLLSGKTVQENVSFPLEIRDMNAADIGKKASDLLRRLKLEGQKNLLPRDLSASQKTLTAVARAVIHAPMILLVDEPTADLSMEEADTVIKLLKELHKNGTTVVLATRNTGLIDVLQARVIELENGILARDHLGGYSGDEMSARRKQQTHTRDAGFSVEMPERDRGKRIRITPIR